MTWKDVTLFQFQQYQNMIRKKDDHDTDLDLAIKALAIMTNRTETEIDSLMVKELNEQVKEIDFLAKTEPQPKPVDVIKVGKKRYRCVYDIRNMPFARYIEAKYFAEDTLFNMHKIGASMVLPMKWTWRGWKVAKYDASKHEEYANDLLGAPYEQIYGSVVFFCQVFVISIRDSKDYLMAKMMAMGMSPEVAEKRVEDLVASLDGFIKLRSSQNTKG